jgi:CRISPR-associated endonuclease Csn1
MSVKSVIPLTIGLDIGIASVGWAVLAPDRIVDLGVRAFDKAETAKKGESLNLVRRTARLMRRRLRRRRWRLTKLARLLHREGLIDNPRMFQLQQPFHKPIWKLRVEGLDRQLAAEEWARVIYHLCKHRGFHWISRAEEKKAETDSKGEGGKVTQGLAETAKRMEEKGYRTVAEMVLAEFPDAQRNKYGDYGKALSRVLLGEELALLFRRQRELGNSHAGAEFEATLLGTGDKKSGLFWKQEPALSGEALLKMLGKCTFEKSEYRAPKASFTAERHVWLTRLNNLRIVVDGKTRPLTDEERRIALPLPYETSELKYGKLRKALTKAGLPGKFRFAGLAYPSDKQKTEEKAKDPEDDKLIKLPGWQELRKTLKDAGLEDDWQNISTDALNGKPQLFDEIARVLTVYKEDDEVIRELGKLDLPNKQKMANALLTVRFDKFSNLSLKALCNILPHMETGLHHDEACENAGYHHSQLYKVGAGVHKYLPPLYSGREKNGRMKFDEDMDIPRNPVVLRALNQARKVVNALFRYGRNARISLRLHRSALPLLRDHAGMVRRGPHRIGHRIQRALRRPATHHRRTARPEPQPHGRRQQYRRRYGQDDRRAKHRRGLYRHTMVRPRRRHPALRVLALVGASLLGWHGGHAASLRVSVHGDGGAIHGGGGGALIHGTAHSLNE